MFNYAYSHYFCQSLVTDSTRSKSYRKTINHAIYLILIFLFSCSDSKEQIVQKEEKFPFSNLSLKEVLDLKSDKIIFLDFYSDT